MLSLSGHNVEIRDIEGERYIRFSFALNETIRLNFIFRRIGQIIHGLTINIDELDKQVNQLFKMFSTNGESIETYHIGDYMGALQRVNQFIKEFEISFYNHLPSYVKYFSNSFIN